MCGSAYFATRKPGLEYVSSVTFPHPRSPTGSLQSSAEELRAMFSALPDTIMVFTLDGVCVSVAPTAAMELIAPLEKAIGNSLVNLFPPADAAIMLGAIKQAASNGVTVDIEHAFVIHGRQRYYEAKITSAADGTFVWVARDITERKYIEEMLLQRQQELMGLLNGFPTFAFVKDHRKRYILVNDVFCQALRIDRSQIIGRSDSDLYSAEVAESYHREDDAILRGDSPLLVTERQRTQNGRVFTVLTRKVPLKDNQGKITGLIGVSFDISDLKEAQRALQVSETRYRSIIENHLELICRHLPEGVITFVNDAFSRYFGLSRDALADKTIDYLIFPEDAVGYFDQIARLNPDNPFYTFDVRFLRADGQTRWHQLSIRAIYNEAGDFVECQSVSRDITEAKLYERDLQYRLTFENLITSLSTHFVNVKLEAIEDSINEALKELGLFAEVDRSYVFLFDESLAAMSNTFEWCAEGVETQMARFSRLPTAPFKWLMKTLRQREIIHIPSMSDLPADASAEHKAFTIRGIKSAVMVPMEAERKLVGFLGFDAIRIEMSWSPDVISLLKIVGEILANAFERHRAGARLRQNDLRNRALLNAVPDLILRLNDVGDILDAKPSSITDEISNTLATPGAKLRAILPMDAYDLFRQNIARSLASGNTLEFQYRHPTPIGEVNYEVRMCVSGFQEVTAFIRNITERVRLDQMKNDFINSATHELRTPVTTCLLMTDLIEEGGSEKEIQEYLGILKLELNRQKQLVEDLLTVGKLEAGIFHLHPVFVDVNKIIMETVLVVTHLAQSKSVSLDVDVYPKLPAFEADTRGLQQVLTNLLSNAIKFTPSSGTVLLQVYPDPPGIVFKVIDTGIGIPPEDIPHLFERFFRARNAVSHQISGSGVGLFIVKSLVEKMNGTINITSELSKGTTFEVWLPSYNNKELSSG
jgi:PAS domain S-box-containing protein